MSEEEIKKILLYLLNAYCFNQTILSIKLRLGYFRPIRHKQPSNSEYEAVYLGMNRGLNCNLSRRSLTISIKCETFSLVSYSEDTVAGVHSSP